MNTARRLFETYHPAVFRFLLRMTGRRVVAEDLLQETFLRVVRARPESRIEGRERAWLFRIARNVVLTRRRGDARRPRPAALEEEPAGSAAAPPLENLALEQALARLRDDHREAFLLREVGGLGYDEIASACDVTPDAVRNRIYRARQELRAVLAAGPRGEVRRFPKEKTT